MGAGLVPGAMRSSTSPPFARGLVRGRNTAVNSPPGLASATVTHSQAPPAGGRRPARDSTSTSSSATSSAGISHPGASGLAATGPAPSGAVIMARRVRASGRHGAHGGQRAARLRCRNQAACPRLVQRHGHRGRAPGARSGPVVTAGLRLRVDPIACDGRGLCAELPPGLITLDDWGFPLISSQDVPAALRGDVSAVVQLCPGSRCGWKPGATAKIPGLGPGRSGRVPGAVSRSGLIAVHPGRAVAAARAGRDRHAEP